MIFPQNQVLTGYFLSAVKVFLFILAAMFVFLSIIVVKQVASITKSVSDKFNPTLTLVSYIFLILTLILVLTVLTL